MGSIPTIQFLICTINERILQIPTLLLPPSLGISYLVSWQQTSEHNLLLSQIEIQKVLSFLSLRSDVSLIFCHGKGISRNRNNALAHASGDLLVIGDDDCTYTEESIFHIRRAFEMYPSASIIQMQMYSHKGRPVHNYPNFSYNYDDAPRGTYFSSCELVLRRSEKLPRFDERFGIGAYLGCGEEEVFVHHARRAGLHIQYVPFYLVTTDESTTGTMFEYSRSVQRAKGGVLSVLYGPFSAFLRCVKFVFIISDLPLRKKIQSFVQTVKGICYEVYTHHTVL